MSRSLSDRSEIDELVCLSGKQDPSMRWVRSLLDSGESRLEWCRGSWTDDGTLVAAHAFDSWSPLGDPGPVPTCVHLLGHTDEASAVELLTADMVAFDASSVTARLVVATDATPELLALRGSQRRVLDRAGFRVRVERVRLCWPSTRPVPRPTGRLVFQPVEAFPRQVVEAIFAAVSDGSADNGMQQERAASGREKEASDRLDRALHRDCPATWFVIGLDVAGTPVGYVQAGIADRDRATLAEIGVVESQRGHRYVDELLAYGTAIVGDAGITDLVSDTDLANTAMRRAFSRAGYLEFASRTDYMWRRSTG